MQLSFPTPSLSREPPQPLDQILEWSAPVGSCISCGPPLLDMEMSIPSHPIGWENLSTPSDSTQEKAAHLCTAIKIKGYCSLGPRVNPMRRGLCTMREPCLVSIDRHGPLCWFWVWIVHGPCGLVGPIGWLFLFLFFFCFRSSFGVWI